MPKIIYLCVLVAVCQADIPVAPPQGTPPPPVLCGEIPNSIYKCLGNPRLVNYDVTAQCTKSISECEKTKCIFQKSGWLTADNKVDRQKVTAHFDQYGKDHPEWSPAVQHVKAACLSTELPAQGVYVNCPSYDVVHCALTGFFKNAQVSQWSSSQECNYPRQWAALCPVCPSDCFAAAIPNGSCNACRLLPQTP